MAEEKKKGNKLIVILLIAVIVVVLGSAGTITYFVVFKSKVSGPVKPVKLEEKTLALDDFIVNLADSDSKVYLKITLVLAYTDKNLDKELPTKTFQIRDAVNTLLIKKTSKDFSDKGLANVKKQLIDSVNSVLENGKITNIYLQNIIIQ